MELIGDRMHPVALVAKIKHGKGFRRYPLQFADLLFGIPPWTLMHALFGLSIAQIRSKLGQPESRNAEEALIQLYGKPLYRYFFKDFTHRYWGIPPTRLSATFVKRKMPRLSAVDIIKNWLAKFGFKEKRDIAVEGALRKETLYYSSIGASTLPKGLAEYVEHHRGTVVLNAEVTGVNVEDGVVTSVSYRTPEGPQTIECDACLSTIPINDMVRTMRPEPDDDVISSCAQLRHKAMAIYGLLVRKERVLEDALYIYFRDHAFHRFSEPKASGVEIVPEGHTTLLVEVTCDVGDDTWNGGQKTKDRIVADLEAEGMITRDDVVEIHVLNNAHGYPVFELGFEPHLDRLMKYVAQFKNLRSTGRQGGFCYPNMHSAMRMGIDAAKELVAHWIEVGAGGGGETVEALESI
jgi:protoporphyrinogen oxidase